MKVHLKPVWEHPFSVDGAAIVRGRRSTTQGDGHISVRRTRRGFTAVSGIIVQQSIGAERTEPYERTTPFPLFRPDVYTYPRGRAAPA